MFCCLASSCFFLLSSSLRLTWNVRALRPNIRIVHTFSFHLSYTSTLCALRRTLCSQPRSDTVTTIARIAEITVHSTDFRLSCEHRWFCIQFANFLCDSHNNSARLITYGLSWEHSNALRFIVPFHVLLCCLAVTSFFIPSSSLHLTWTLPHLRTNIRSVHTFSLKISLRALRTLCSQSNSETARGLHYYCVHCTNCCPLHWRQAKLWESVILHPVRGFP